MPGTVVDEATEWFDPSLTAPGTGSSFATYRDEAPGTVSGTGSGVATCVDALRTMSGVRLGCAPDGPPWRDARRGGDHVGMEEQTMLRFGELVETARSLGFDLYDSQDLLVDPQLEMALEDENLVAESVHVSFRSAPAHQERGIVADLTVGAQVFHLRGEWSLARELEQVVHGARATPGASSLGEPPEDSEEPPGSPERP